MYKNENVPQCHAFCMQSLRISSRAALKEGSWNTTSIDYALQTDGIEQKLAKYFRQLKVELIKKLL